MLRYLDQCIFCKVHSIGPLNVCANFEINRFKIDEFRKHTKSYFYLTSRDANTVRRTSWDLDSSDRYFHLLVATNQKSLRLPVQKLRFKKWF